MLLSAAQAAAGRVRVYRSATVIDGTGADRFVADVAVEGSRVVAVGDVDAEVPAGAVEVPAAGLVLAPGFIDMHAHSDLAVLRGADHTAKLLQGVTTEVLGQDGIGYAPVDDAALSAVADQIAGWNGPLAGAPWRSMDEYLTHIDTVTAGNAAVLVPQGNLRILAMGYEQRAATASELVTMVSYLEQSLDAGAFGMSSGLTYAPGMFADTAELTALARVVAERGGYWAPHTRGYGGSALAAYREVLDIGRATGCAIHLTHATMNFAPNRGRAAELLALIDAAIADGVDVTLDTYPYLPGATTLAALLPSWVAARGGADIAATVRNLTGGDRAQIAADLAAGCDGFHGEPADWSAIQLSGVASADFAPLVGRAIADIAAERQENAVDTVLDLLAVDGGAIGVLMHVGDEDNVRAIMRHPAHAGGSDGILVGARPHPRAYGAFAKYLGEYSRDLGVLSLEQAVRHLSATPARRLGLDRTDAPRGIIRPGATADLVLFDPEAVAAGSTFDAPRTPPRGFHEVLVSGTVVVKDGVATGQTPGSALRMVPRAHRATIPTATVTTTARERRIDALTWAPHAEVPDDVRSAGQGFLGAAGDAIETVITPDVPVDGYRLTIDADGVRIHAADAIGALRGVLTLVQLRDPHDGSRPVPFGTWESAPANAWRGLMLDVARHFRPVADVERLLDLSALHGLNRFHLHLTDDQGWRYEVPGWPLAAEVGGTRAATQLGHGPYSTVEPGTHAGWYSVADLRHLDAYARARGITIVPEVEFPGHVQALLAAYPQFANADAAPVPTTPWERFGLNPHTLNLEDDTLSFCRDALDVLCDAFAGELIGIGGDEVPTKEWAASARVTERMAELELSDVHDVQPWFTAQLAAHLASRGRRAFAWDEVLAGDVPPGVVVAAWRGPVAAAAALSRGFECVACDDLQAYLDYRQSESEDEPVPVGPPLTVEGTWQFRVPPGAMGGQVNVWTEHLTTRDEVDFAVFPRLAAIAQRLWVGSEPGEWREFEPTLNAHLQRLAAWGVRYRPLDGPSPAQRKPGVPGVPRTRAEREATVAELVADLDVDGASRNGYSQVTTQ